MSAAVVARPNHLDSLTGLRFFAALCVVLLHVGQRFDPVAGMTKAVGLGYAGVSFFFVLSGFILAWTHRPADTPGNFYWRRFARVWPLHALTTAFAIGVAVAVNLPVQWPALPFVMTLTQAWFPAADIKYSLNGPSWSLSCEMFFYLLFPFMIQRLLGIRKILSAITTVAIVMVLFAATCAVLFPSEQLGYYLYTMPLYRAGEFLIGICLAIAFQRGWRPRWTMKQALILTAVMYLVLIAASNVVLHDVARLPYFVAGLWMLPCFLGIIAAGADGDLGGVGGPLRSVWLGRLGAWSFALYLVHELVLKLVEPLADRVDTLGGVALTIAAVLASIALSGIFYVFFERPVERWLRSRVTGKRVPATREHVTT